MTTTIENQNDRTALRGAMERIIAHYPEISDDELHSLLHYFRRDASAYDRAIIAGNPELGDRYRRLSDDHSLDRLGKVEIGITLLFVLLVLLGILYFLLGG